MWADKVNQIYSERKDLTPEAFALLVKLTLARREVATAGTARALWDQDQATILAFLETANGNAK